MTLFEVLSTLLALLAAIISLVSLYRTREVAARQVELQERQLGLEAESARLAKLQRLQIEAGARYPTLSTKVFSVTIHYSDADVKDTAIELVFENGSSLNRSINDCTVGLLDKPTDALPGIARQAQFRDEHAKYPVSLPPHASLILYAFARYLEPIYKERYGTGATESKTVAVVVEVAGIAEPLIRVVARYAPHTGLTAQ